jgi:hypothetical protein
MELSPKRLSIETPVDLVDATMRLAPLQSL